MDFPWRNRKTYFPWSSILMRFMRSGRGRVSASVGWNLPPSTTNGKFVYETGLTATLRKKPQACLLCARCFVFEQTCYAIAFRYHSVFFCARCLVLRGRVKPVLIRNNSSKHNYVQSKSTMDGVFACKHYFFLLRGFQEQFLMG